MFRYENILVVPLEENIVRFADPLVEAYVIFDVSKIPVTSFGLYNESHGVEYIIEPTGDIHGYRRMKVEDVNACCHWIFDFVDRDVIKNGSLADSLKLYDYTKRGSFQTVFDYMKMMLDKLTVEEVLI